MYGSHNLFLTFLLTALTIAANFAVVNKKWCKEMNCAIFQKVLEFMLTQANHAKLAPHTQQGVQIILDGREVSFVAVDSGATTTVQMLPQRVSGGKGEFFLPFEDVENLIPHLRWENSGGRDGLAEVVLSRSEQPQIPGRVCLLIAINDWSEHFTGLYKQGGHPKRSAIHSLEELTLQDAKNAARSLKMLSTGAGYSWRKEGTNGWFVKLAAPINGVKSVSKVIY